MLRHLDDTSPPIGDSQRLIEVLQRAERIRARWRRRLMAGAVTVVACLIAVAATLVAVRPSPVVPTSRQANYLFDRQANPLPGGTSVPATTLIDVVFVGRADGFGLADHRNQLVLAATRDGGTSWTVVDGALPMTLQQAGADAQLEFTSPLIGYLWRGPITGAAQAPMWITHDGGTTWTSAPIGPVVYDVSAIQTNVWALVGTCLTPGGASCKLQLRISVDAGTAWGRTITVPSVVATPSASSSVIVQLARVNLDSAYVYSQVSEGQVNLSYTAADGTTWASRTDPCGTTPNAFDAGGELALSSTQDLWLICGGAASGGTQAKVLYRSENGGVSWTGVASTPPSAIKGASPTLPLQGYVAPYSIGHKNLAVLSVTSAWLFPTGGAVYSTADQGESWQAVTGLQAADFGSGGAGNVTFIDNTHGWVVEFGVGLWRTTNATTWEPVGS